MDDAQVFEAMAGALVERGLISNDLVAADRAAMAAGPDAEPAPAPAATATAPAQPQTLDAQVFQGAASPQAYTFDPLPHGVQADVEQQAKLAAFYHGEGFNPGVAREITKQVHLATINPPSQAQIDASHGTALQALTKQWGADTDKNLAIANAEITRMEQRMPGLKDTLRTTGLCNSVWLTSTIFNMAQARGRA